MQIRIFKDGEQRGPYSEAEVLRFVQNGAYDKNDLGWTERTRKWVPLADILNPTPNQTRPALPNASYIPPAVKAGWICVALGVCTYWFFGLGHLFFGIAIVLAIVAMCKDQIKHGIALVVSAFTGMLICWLIVFFTVMAGATAVATKVVQKIEETKPQITQAQPPYQTRSSQTPRPIVQQLLLPAPAPQGRFIKPQDVLNSQEALTTADISLMIRNSIPQNEIIQNVHQRGLVKAIVGSDATRLQQMGAVNGLLSELKNYEFVLTPDEYQRYLSRQAKRSVNSIKTQQPRNSLDDTERRRLQTLQDQQMAIAAKDQRERDAKKAQIDQQMKVDRAKQEWINKNHFSAPLVEAIQKQ